MPWIDSHNHLHFLPPDELAGVMDALADAGVEQAVVNATTEADWEAVAELAKRWPERIVPAFGMHPWQVEDLAVGWQGRLRELLIATPQAGIGECGLDRLRGGAGMALQRAVLEDHLRLARELGRTVSIHCVKAWGELLNSLLATRPPEKFLLHSFAGTLDLAQRLVPLGAYFSFSPNHWEHGSARELEVFRQLPRERLLIESDAPRRPGQSAASGRSPVDLPVTGALLAEALGLPLAELAALTCRNARECFGC